MAPKKEGSAPALKGKEADDAVLSYLISQNRPYGSTDISANLHNAVSKPAASKILADLAKRELIVERVFGKQAIYGPKQEEDDGWAAGEYEEAEEEVKRMGEEERDLKEALTKLKAQQRALENAPPTEQLAGKINSNKTKLASVQAELAPLIAAAEQASSCSSSTLESRLPDLLKSLTEVRKHAQVRRKWHKELAGTIGEFMNKTSKEPVWDAAGGSDEVNEMNGDEFERKVWDKVAREDDENKPKIVLAGGGGKKGKR